MYDFSTCSTYFLAHAQPHPFRAAERGGFRTIYNYVRIDPHARATHGAVGMKYACAALSRARSSPARVT